MKLDSTHIIGNVKERFAEVFRPDRRWDEWRSFYNGWLEGRSDLLISINRGNNNPRKKGMYIEELEENKVAYEFYNQDTGHCYVDYIDAEGMGEKDGYTKTRLYKIE